MEPVQLAVETTNLLEDIVLGVLFLDGEVDQTTQRLRLIR
jgi:hypothetical protein